jgi:hypothetical protein
MTVIAVLLGTSACIDTPPMAEPEVEQSRVQSFDIPESVTAKTDKLIVVDDTQATGPYRGQLATLPARLAERIDSYIRRWVDMRVAVTGNDGKLRRLPGMDTPWLSDVIDFNYNRRTSYTGTLDDALGALMNVGGDNAGPNQPLDAARRALENNAQFVRDDAGIMIITVAATDDASPAPVADYVDWIRRIVSNTWQRELLVSGFYAQSAPRLDEYYKLLEPFSIVTPLESDNDGAALPWVPTSGFWGTVSCIGDLDLDPSTTALEHECALLALVDGAWRAIPECATPTGEIERNVRERSSAPPPACWWLRPDSNQCFEKNSYDLALSGYSEFRHPALHLECRAP